MGYGALKYAKLKRFYDDPSTRADLIEDLLEGLEDGTYKPSDFSIRDMFRALIPGGPELCEMMSFRKSGGRSIRDVREAAGDAINTGDFASITGQFLFTRMLDGYNYPQALWPSLVETFDTQLLNGQRLPGVGGFGYTNVEVVGQGEEFPKMGLNEEFVDTVPLQKRGFIAEVTREAVIADLTGLLLKQAGDGGRWLSIQKDIRCIAAATGYANNYTRNGVSTGTFLLAGSYINQTSVPLVNWQSVQTAELLLAGITDPNTGAPVVLEATQLLVPLALKRTSNFLMQAGSVAQVDNTPTANTTRSYGDNPMAQGYWGQKRADVLCNSFVGNKAVTGGASNNVTAWYLGDFKKAILYMQAWGVEVTQAAPNSPQSFYRDVVMGWKFAECGVAQIQQPRYMIKGNS